MISNKRPPKTTDRQVAAWLEHLPGSPRDAALAVEALGWAQRLPELAQVVEPLAMRGLVDALVGLARAPRDENLDRQPLVHQLLAVELAWTLAALAPDVPAARLEKSGRAALALGLGKLLDSEGVPPARHLPLVRPLLACWTRCRELARSLPAGGFGPRAEQRFQRFLRTAMRLTRADGRPVFAADESQAWEKDLFAAALADDRQGPAARIAALALPPGGKSKPGKRTVDLPSPGVHSEQAAVAVLRRNWQRNDERLTVLFADQTCQLELTCSGRVVFSGPWQFEVTHEGTALPPVSSWRSNCWHSDEDVDYLELEINLADGTRLERHCVLARQDRFLLLADGVLGARPGPYIYSGSLPLAKGMEFRGEKESHEGWIVSGRPLAQILPLALPEWRADVRAGGLSASAAAVRLQQGTEGRRLFAPLFFDLDRGRFRRRMTWRQLTVAESREALPVDVAVGYRVAIGAEQWLIYRALAARGNRTLLGHNLSTETLVARFADDGEVTPIIEIE